MTTVPYTFGNETSPIPLSQLDANFAVNPNYANTAGNVVNAVQANITSVGTLTSLSVSGNIAGGNIQLPGIISASGNLTVGNISTGGIISAYGNITGGSFNSLGAITSSGAISAVGIVTGSNFNTVGVLSATGNVRGGNINTVGLITATGNITSQGRISATGNIVTAGYFVGNFLGNITGNLSVGGSNTQILFNSNGNVGAAGGLTYTTGSNVLTVLGSVTATGNVSAGNVLISGNQSMVGNITAQGGQFSSTITAQTPVLGTANNQLATTAFVSATVGTLGTMASQNAVSVAIQGGAIGNAIITLASISNSTIANSSITNTTIDRVTMTSGWSVVPNGTTLYFNYNGINLAKLDSTGNFTTLGDVTAFGNIT
jgi:hypothetical protein